MIIEIPNNAASLKDLVEFARSKGLVLKSGRSGGQIILRMVQQEGANNALTDSVSRTPGNSLPDCVVLDVQSTLPDSVHLQTRRATTPGRILEFSNALRRRQMGSTPKATF